jgi:hypothetical protein
MEGQQSQLPNIIWISRFSLIQSLNGAFNRRPFIPKADMLERYGTRLIDCHAAGCMSHVQVCQSFLAYGMYVHSRTQAL